MSLEYSNKEEQAEGAVASFATGLYELAAIKRAAYRFSDRMTVLIEPGQESVICRLQPLKPVSDGALAALKNDFLIEVLDQDLRQTIADETEPFRNLILSIAFSKTGLQG